MVYRTEYGTLCVLYGNNRRRCLIVCVLTLVTGDVVTVECLTNGIHYQVFSIFTYFRM